MLDQFVCICTNILDLNGDNLAYGYHGNLWYQNYIFRKRININVTLVSEILSPMFYCTFCIMKRKFMKLPIHVTFFILFLILQIYSMTSRFGEIPDYIRDIFIGLTEPDHRRRMTPDMILDILDRDTFICIH